ncbi:MAG TPA: hypothetical protein VHA80_10105 [Solirubrobacterales bacterium]|nr:hypothetical protein [Solirubrobacterales bacterium]
MIQKRFSIFAAAAATLALVAAGPAAAEDHFTPLSARVLHAPEPVRGGDGREHLVYELVLANEAAFPPGPVTVRKIVAEAGGKPVETLSGAHLQEMMEPFGVVNERTPRTTIQPGGTAKVLMDVSYPAGARAPRRLAHEIVVSPGPPASVELSRFAAAPTPWSLDRRRSSRRRCAGPAGSSSTAAATKTPRTGAASWRSTAPCTRASATRSTSSR